MSTRDGLNDTRRNRRQPEIKQEEGEDGKDGVGINQRKGERQRSVHFEGDVPLVVIEIQMKDKVGVIPIFEFSNPKDLAQQFAKKNALDEQTRKHVLRYIIDEMNAALTQKNNKTGMVKSQSSAALISQPRVFNEEKQLKQGMKYQGNVEDLDQPQPRKQPPIQQKVPESLVQQTRIEEKVNSQNNERLKRGSKNEKYEELNKDEDEQDIRQARQSRNKGIYYYNEDNDEQKRNMQRTKKKDTDFEREQRRDNADSQRGMQNENKNRVGKGYQSNGFGDQRAPTTEMVDQNNIQAQRINNKRNQDSLQLQQQGQGRKRGQNNQYQLEEQEQQRQLRQNNTQQEEEQEEEKEFTTDIQLKESEGRQLQGKKTDEGDNFEERQVDQFKEHILQKNEKTRTNGNNQIASFQGTGKKYYEKQKIDNRDNYSDEDGEEEEESKRNKYIQDPREVRPKIMNLRAQPDQNTDQLPEPTAADYDNRKQSNYTNQDNRNNNILKAYETVLENNSQGIKRAQNGQLRQIRVENGVSYPQINPNETTEINQSQRLPQEPPNPLSTFQSPTMKAPDLSSYQSPPINQQNSQPYTSPFYQPSPYQQNQQNYQLQSQSPAILSTSNLQQQMQVIPQNLPNQTAQFLPQSNQQQLNPSKSASLLNFPVQFTFQSPNPQFSSPATLQSQSAFQQPPQYYQYPNYSPMQSPQISQLPINQQPSQNDFLQQQRIVDNNNNSHFIQNQAFFNNQQPQMNIQQISSPSFQESQLRMNQQQQLWYEQQYLQQSMQPYQNNPFQPIDQMQSINYSYSTKSNQGNLTPTRRRIFLDSSVSNRSQPFSMKLPAVQGAPGNPNDSQNNSTGIVTQSSQNYQPVQQQQYQIVTLPTTQKESLIEIIQRRQEEEFAQRGIGKNAVVLQNVVVQEKAINPAQRMQPQEFEKTNKQLFIQGESDITNEESMLPSPQGDEAMRAIQKCFARLDDRNRGRINLSEAQSLVSNLRDASAEMKRELSRLISKASSSKLISSLDFSQFYCLAITDFPELVNYCKEAYDGQTSPQFQTIPQRPPSFGSTNQETSSVF